MVQITLCMTILWADVLVFWKEQSMDWEITELSVKLLQKDRSPQQKIPLENSLYKQFLLKEV